MINELLTLAKLENMIIRFDEMEASVLPAFKGGEKELVAKMFFDGTNRIFRGTLVPGASIGMHTHEGSCEVIFILRGNGTLIEQAPSEASPESRSVTAGDCLYCPEGHAHSLMNTSEEDLEFHAVVAKQ